MLIAVCGFAGAGKTTAVEMLERLGEGAKVYVGSHVTDEVARRGMAATPESERAIRQELRDSHGMAALAQRALPTINGILDVGRVALVDAIYCEEEYEFYRHRLSARVIRLAIEAAKSERVKRLAIRSSRPLNADALTKRDEFESTQLGLVNVMATAECRIINNGSLNDLECTLQQFAISLRL